MTPAEAAVIAAELKGLVVRFEEYAGRTERSLEEIKEKQDFTNGKVRKHDEELAEHRGELKATFWKNPLVIALVPTIIGSGLSAFIFGVLIH